MKVKDHFLSQEVFEIKPSEYDGVLKTVPQPSAKDLPRYYDSNEYISHQTESKSIKDFIYQKVKSLMLQKKKQWILNYKSQGKILDIGAGTGDFLHCFKTNNWEKFALEPSSKLHELLTKKKISLIKDLKEIDNNTFDIITLWHSLEHIPDIENTLTELQRIIKKDGVLFIAVPNYKSYDAKLYKTNWAAWDVPRHLWHFSRNGLKKLLEKFSFHCQDEKGLFFDAFYVSLLSENYTKNGSSLKSLYTGFISNLKARQNKEYSSVLYILKADNKL
jgi:2-polyprenyl-3-methyl-5-hydroxy-6-metoxy-1,4-benzoquinol methylase